MRARQPRRKPEPARQPTPYARTDEQARSASQRGLADAIDQGPRATHQRAQLKRMFGATASWAEATPGPAPVQRKILVDRVNYPATDKSSTPVREAAQDEFIRHYDSEQEAINHLDKKAATSCGLVKQRALWYRMPFLGRQFFVFGESHAAVRGSVIKAESNITAPILDEQIQGWSVGEALGDSTEDVGVDENASKLLRALEAWDPGQGPSQPSTTSEQPPEIPYGEASTRDRRRGTYRLVVPGEGGQASWWKPSGQADAPQSTHDFEGELLSAIRTLFPLVFGEEIKTETLDTVEFGAQMAWKNFPTKPWDGNRTSLRIRRSVRDSLLAAARAKASGEYAKLRSTHGIDTQAEDKKNWTADDYRNEFMFVRIQQAAARGSYAFATVGDLHLQALKRRLAAKGIPCVTMADFFDRYSQDAVNTKAIAQVHSPRFRKNQRLVLWLQGALREYPNLQQMHLDELTDPDMGEFVRRGMVSRWERADVEAVGGVHNEPVLRQVLQDLEQAYPGGAKRISELSLAQLGEFLFEGKVAAWDTQ